MAVLFTDAAPIVVGFDSVIQRQRNGVTPFPWQHMGTYTVMVTWELLKNKDDVVDVGVTGRWPGSMVATTSWPAYNTGTITYQPYSQVTYAGNYYYNPATLTNPGAFNAANWFPAFKFVRAHLSFSDPNATPPKWHWREEYTYTQPAWVDD